MGRTRRDALSVTGRVLFALSVTALHSGCGEKLDPLRPSLEPPPATSSAPCWERDIQPFITKRCIVCHGAGHAVDLSSWELVRLTLEPIEFRVGGGQMPPSGPLDSSESNPLLRWIAAGGPRCGP